MGVAVVAVDAVECDGCQRLRGQVLHQRQEQGVHAQGVRAQGVRGCTQVCLPLLRLRPVGV